MTDKKFDNNKIIHKSANNSLMVIFEDMTNDTWDLKSKDDEGNKIRNNIQIKFIRFDKQNNTQQYIPLFVGADELMSVMGAIKTGNFSKTFSNYKNYGGGKPLAKERKGSELIDSINKKLEARIFSIYINNDNKLTLQAESFNGLSTNRGAIKKQGDAKSRLYLSLDNVRAMTMAEAVHSYLLARKTICISSYFRKQ